MKKLLPSIFVLFSLSSNALSPNIIVCASDEGIKINFSPDGLVIKNAENEFSSAPGDIIKNPSIIGTLMSIKELSVEDIGTTFVSFVVPEIELPDENAKVPFVSLYLESISKKGVTAPYFEAGLLSQVTDFKVLSCLAALKK